MSLLLLALLSGVPALVYQVVWTREVALLAGSQIEAISLVLVAFFGGLAAGALALGRRADRSPVPLRLYAALELAAGALAALSPFWLRALSALPLPPAGALALATGSLFAVAMLLGGTLPALLRAASRSGEAPALSAGRLVAANTFGAIAGVGLAVAGIPTLGLSRSIWTAAALALGLGLLALGLAWGRAPLPVVARRVAVPAAPAGILLAAALAGVATLAFEVTTARLAALRLGSSLLAWGIVLASVLAGLTLGNAAGAGRAARTSSPARDLGWIELGAAITLALAARVLSPSLSRPAAGLTAGGLGAATLATLLPALCMGAAFPFFVRLAVGRERLAEGFGATSAANTAGGIAGALLAPFLLLPWVGPSGALLACGLLNLALCGAFLSRAGRSWLPALALGGVTLTLAALVPSPPAESQDRVIFARHGAQATVAVTRTPARRDLLVDGDPEASTAGSARETEELLALLPLVLHPGAVRLLEIGLGSGITLATAATFPLEQLDCVEIADPVRTAAAYFAPDNEPVASAGDSRVRVLAGDGRAYLVRHRQRYDVVLANTLHPWSIGATGLYSSEYFERIAASLRSGGVAAQWVPAERIGAAALAAIVRTFFEAFEHGAVWWGADNLLLVGSRRELPLPSEARFAALPDAARTRLARLGIRDADDLRARRIAGARTVRALVGAAAVLVDDRPRLERLATRAAQDPAAEIGWVVELARAEPEHPSELLRLHLEALSAERAGEAERAERLERLAIDGGLELARRSAAAREAERGRRAFQAADERAASAAFERAVALQPGQPTATFGLAVLAAASGRQAEAAARLSRLVARHPMHAEAWNLLGAFRRELGDESGAAAAFAASLRADPFLPEAIANAGLLALEQGDVATARSLYRRLREIRQGNSPEAAALGAAIEQATR